MAPQPSRALRPKPRGTARLGSGRAPARRRLECWRSGLQRWLVPWGSVMYFARRPRYGRPGTKARAKGIGGMGGNVSRRALLKGAAAGTAAVAVPAGAARASNAARLIRSVDVAIVG